MAALGVDVAGAPLLGGGPDVPLLTGAHRRYVASGKAVLVAFHGFIMCVAAPPTARHNAPPYVRAISQYLAPLTSTLGALLPHARGGSQPLPAQLRALLEPIKPVYNLTDPRLAFRGIKGCGLLLRRVLGDFVRATLCFWPDRAVSRWLDRVKTDNDRECSDNSLIQASAFADFSDATGEAGNDDGNGDGYGNGGVG